MAALIHRIAERDLSGEEVKCIGCIAGELVACGDLGDVLKPLELNRDIYRDVFGQYIRRRFGGLARECVSIHLLAVVEG